MTTAAKSRQQAKQNGKPSEPNPLTEAVAYEEAIRVEAEEIRGDAIDLTPELLRKLRPLLRKPIPAAFIQTVPVVKGKPYESTGIKSVQVQLDRLDNVLGADWWGYTRTYLEQGKLCEVVAWIGSDPTIPLVKRDSMGGVNQASTTGNLYKGSFTNAAKPAFARLGPGWEVYVGATDFDPDTSEEAAQAQAEGGEKAPTVERIAGKQVAELVDEYRDLKGRVADPDKLARDVKLYLGSMGVPTPSLNEAFGALTPAQHEDMRHWLADQSAAVES